MQIAQLRSEKCELQEARTAYFLGLQQAKKQHKPTLIMEALAGLLRLSSEALDERAIEQWERELDHAMKHYPRQIPPMAWYCKGAVARHRGNLMLAQRFFHRYLRAVRTQKAPPERIARGWIMLATLLQGRNRHKRSRWLAKEILRRYESLNLRGINGIIYLLLGTLDERQGETLQALKWFRKADAQFLGEHNWYYHLYAIYGYARIARSQRKFAQAAWYLNLVDRASASPEFGLLQKEIARERLRLRTDEVDLLIDSRKGLIKTRESGTVSLGKQHLLLQILESLFKAHNQKGEDIGRGLSKAELIESVWKEPYQSTLHDSKLYYNINRLRKLLEPDIRKPRYLQNWRQGYRLAPGLRIQHLTHPQPQLEGDTS